ncbi:MAG: VWA domain-containing protein [Acidobacteriota bacterium]|nr:VWA domain-containing protein [Acidobacteriota bacterium]
MQKTKIRTIAFFLIFGLLIIAPIATPTAAQTEKNPSTQAEPVAPGVIKAEAKMVLVDVVVTDKKKNYLKDLTQKDFHVFEDGKEQPITSFSREADIKPGTPGRQRYMVLLFDNASLDPAGQMWERDAASKFVESTASPLRMMAVMDYGGELLVDQTFTANADLLMAAVRSPKFSHVLTQQMSVVARARSLLNVPTATGAEQDAADLALRNLLRSIRDVAKMLGAAPGRKELILLSAGFNLTSQRQSDFQDTLDALNKANVGVYPVDPSGFKPAVSATATRMASGSEASPVLYAFAAKTGGFPVVNTNDLKGGMEKASGELDEYYILGYVPPNPGREGSYHRIRVKVDRGGTEVRARSGYAETRSPDILAGKTEGVALEAKVASFEAGEIPITLSTPYFYVKPGIARVNLALSIPATAVKFDKRGDNFRSQISVLGIAYRDDGSVAARFSDTSNLDYEKDEIKEARKADLNYQTSFKIAPGDYTFKLVLSAGSEKFGKYVVPLSIDPFSGKQFTLSGPAFGDRSLPSPLSSADIDQKLIEGSAPMVASGLQVIPSSKNRFTKEMQPVVYVEVYDPLLESNSPQMGILYEIVNRQTHQKAYSSDTIYINHNIHPGNPLVPVVFKLPMDQLPAGNYEIKIWARDSAGGITPPQTGNFSIE